MTNAPPVPLPNDSDDEKRKANASPSHFLFSRAMRAFKRCKVCLRILPISFFVEIKTKNDFHMDICWLLSMAVFREEEDSYPYKIVGLVALLFNDVDWQGEARRGTVPSRPRSFE